MTRILPLARAAVATVLAAIMLSAAASAAEIRVDASRIDGRLRPLHGVNNGPLNQGETLDVSEAWKALGVPLARLHDAEWPYPNIVDMHAVFPDMAADPADPAAYRFAATDRYIDAIIRAGAGVVYRLGESIEHAPVKVHVHPPADPARWAEACAGVVRHYNHGWADGRRVAIRYWEIWNEPENRPAMWSGSDDDYVRLYVTAARRIKAEFPDVLVGGPSSGAPGDVGPDGRLRPAALPAALLRACRDDKAPLDFFSWHTYSGDPSVYAPKARAIRAWLDAEGFAKTQIHLNEWNYLPDGDWTPMLGGTGDQRARWYARMGGPEGAAFLACVLIDLQDAPVDVSNYYTGDSSAFGVFTREGVPKKTYWALRAFRSLMDTPRRAGVAGAEPGRWACAAGVTDDAPAGAGGSGAASAGGNSTIGVLLSVFRPADRPLRLRVENPPWAGASRWELAAVDSTHSLDVIERGRTSTDAGGNAVAMDLQPREPTVYLLRITREQVTPASP
jgi:hypothetical protein